MRIEIIKHTSGLDDRNYLGYCEHRIVSEIVEDDGRKIPLPGEKLESTARSYNCIVISTASHTVMNMDMSVRQCFETDMKMIRGHHEHLEKLAQAIRRERAEARAAEKK